MNLADQAVAALLAELETYPKPGLVSPVDPGSHADMDADLLRRSAHVLHPYFAQLSTLGRAEFPLLRQVGVHAENAMLRETGGVNTHRGAIFSLGLLCAAGGDPDRVRQRWSAAIAAMPARGSHGARVMQDHGVGGARAEAAAGFPTVLRTGLPALRFGLTQTGDFHAARVQLCFALVAVLDDTNILHRGGADGLRFAQQTARGFLIAGGVGAPGWRERAGAIHRAFVLRNLSPGGAADLMAVTLFLHAVQTQAMPLRHVTA